MTPAPANRPAGEQPLSSGRTPSVRVAVLGAAGRMGSAVCAAVLADPRLELAAAVDPAYSPPGGDGAAALAARAATRGVASLLQLEPAEPIDVAVDFTNAAAVLANAAWCAERGVHLVCGTTGLGEPGVARLAELFGSAQGPNCVVAANFAVSAVLMMRFAELAAPFFEGVEIVELHHGDKRDAPSGTAIETARRIARARRDSGSGPFATDPTQESLEGARGAAITAGPACSSEEPAGVGDSAAGERNAGEISVPVHAVRLVGLVAHQEVIFGAAGQSLTIRQDSYDRASFMPGVLLAIREVASRPGLTVGLEALLGL